MEHPDDVSSPFVWLSGDSFWNDLLSMIFAGSAWPEGSETAVWDLAQEWFDLADGLSVASDGLQTAAADLLAAWDAPAAESFDDLARKLLGSPEFGLPGHVQNAAAIGQQASGFGVDLQYAKISVNVAVVVAAIAAVVAVVMAWAGGLSLTTLGPIASTARQAVIAALEKLASAAGRKALVEGVGRAVAEQTTAVVSRAAAHSAGRHLTYEIAEEVLEELVIDVTTQAWQMSEGTRTDWNVLSTVQAGLGGGFGGAAGAGLVAPVFARLRRSPRVTALAGLGADGSRLARAGNFGIRHTGGLAATAGTNAVASPAGGIAASLLTGQGFPALDGSTFGMAALGAVGRYGSVSPTNPAVLSAAVHPVQTLSQVHVDALAGHTGQKAREAAAGAAADAETTSVTTTAPGTTNHGTTSPTRGASGAAPSSTAPAPATGRTASAATVGGGSTMAGTTTAVPAAAQPAAATAHVATTAPPSSAGPTSSAPAVASSPAAGSTAAPATATAAPATGSSSASPSTSATSSQATSSSSSSSPAPSGQTQGNANGSSTDRDGAAPADQTSTGTGAPSTSSETIDVAAPAGEASTPTPAESTGPVTAATAPTPVQATAAQTASATTQPGSPSTNPGQAGASRPAPTDGTSTGSATDVQTGTTADVQPGVTTESAAASDAAADATTAEEMADSGPSGPQQSVPASATPARVDRVKASLDRLAADLTAIAAADGGGSVSRADVEQALVHQSAQTESQRTARVRAREQALREIAARKAGRPTTRSQRGADPGLSAGAPLEGQTTSDTVPEPGAEVGTETGANGEVPVDAAVEVEESAMELRPAAGLPVTPEDPPGPPPEEGASPEWDAFRAAPAFVQREVQLHVAAVDHLAAEVQATLEQSIARVAAEEQLPPAELIGLVHRVKTPHSLLRKITGLLQKGRTIAAAVRAQDDVLRYSVQTHPTGYDVTVNGVLDGLRTSGWSVPPHLTPEGKPHPDWRNKWVLGNQYHGFAVILTHEASGQRMEVQFPTRESASLGKKTHKPYEVWRNDTYSAVERVAHLGAILDLVNKAEVEERFPEGVDRLGPAYDNGPARSLGDAPDLARDFLQQALAETGSVEQTLIDRGVTPRTVAILISAAEFAVNGSREARGEQADGGHRRPGSPRLGPVGSNPRAAQGGLGADEEVEGGDGAGAPAVPAVAGDPAGGTPGRAGDERGGGVPEGPDVHVLGHEVGRDVPGSGGGTERAAAAPGSGAVRRVPGWGVDLRPEAAVGDPAPGLPGAALDADPGEPGGGRAGGERAGADAAERGATPGDLREPDRGAVRLERDAGGPGGAELGGAQVGDDTATALEQVLLGVEPVWSGQDGDQRAVELRLADGSSLLITSGPNSLTTSDPGRPLQTWAIGHVHLDDGGLTAAAATFLADLRVALARPEDGGPSSIWLAQRVGLPTTHRMVGWGRAEPTSGDTGALVWDAAQGWVADGPERASVVGHVFVPVGRFAVDQVGGVVEMGAGEVLDAVRRTHDAEGAAARASIDGHGLIDEATAGRRARERSVLHTAAERLAAYSLVPAVEAFLREPVVAVHSTGGAGTPIAVRTATGWALVGPVAARSAPLPGSAPGTGPQWGTPAATESFLSDVAATPGADDVAAQLRGAQRSGHLRVLSATPAITGAELVGTRITEFASSLLVQGGAGTFDGSPGFARSDPAAGPGPVPQPTDGLAGERGLSDVAPERVVDQATLLIAGAQPVFERARRDLVAETGPRQELVGLRHGVKPLTALLRKIKPSLQAGQTLSRVVADLDDLVRFSVRTDPDRYGHDVLALLAGLRSAGWTVPGPERPHPDWRNTWAKGNRHLGLLVAISDGVTGQRVELQFPTPKSRWVAELTHRFYETFRMVEADAVDRVVALARIRSVVIESGIERDEMQGLGDLGLAEANGSFAVFGMEPELAQAFVARSGGDDAARLDLLREAGVSDAAAREVVEATNAVVSESSSGDKSRTSDGGSDEHGTTGVGQLGGTILGGPPGMGALAEGPGGPSSPLGGGAGVLSADGSAGSTETSAPRGSGHSAPRRVGGPTGGGGRGVEALPVPGGGVDGAGDHPGNRDAEQRAGRPGVGAARPHEQPLGLRPGERGGDPAPGGHRGEDRDPSGVQAGGRAGGVGDEGHAAADGGRAVPDLRATAGLIDAAGRFVPGRQAADAWRLLMGNAAGVVMSSISHGSQLSTEIRLLDGSTVGVLTGVSPWARSETDRPVQMWIGGELVLDDGPLSPAAARFLDDLRTALFAPGPEAVPGYRGGPLSQWLAQRATLDPRTHRLDPDGVARPVHEAGEVLVWDAVQGWVPARTAGDLATVVAQTFIPRLAAEGPHADGTVAAVLEAAAELPGALVAGRTAELQAATGGSLDPGRVDARDALAFAADMVSTAAVPWALTELLGVRASPVFTVGGRVLVELADGGMAVVVEATSESAVLPGSRPGLIQAGTTGDLGRFRNELWRASGGRAAAERLTQALASGRVRSFRVQGVVSSSGFVGTRVMEFAVQRGVPAGVGVARADVDPQRHFGPGPGAEIAMAEAAAHDAVPTDPAQRVARGFRLLPLVNPLERFFHLTDAAAVPFRNNCGDVTRAVAELFLGRGARVARGDNAARLGQGGLSPTGLKPGELPEMYSYTGATPSHYLVPGLGATPTGFTGAAWRSVGRAMHGAPVGAVAIVLVNWWGVPAGHWFNAVQAHDGLYWVDGQSNTTARWDAGFPYLTSIGLVGAVVCAGPGEPWRDLRVVHGGPAWGSSGAGPASAGPVHGLALPAHAVEPDDQGRPRRAIDWSLAVSLANATGGEWPDDEPWRERSLAPVTGRTTVAVRSPRGDVVPIDVRRVAGDPPTLVLSELPGAAFWWDVPDAVQQAVEKGCAALAPAADRGTVPVVLARRPAPGGGVELVRYPVDVGAAGPALTGLPTTPSGRDAARARAALGLLD